MCNTNTMFSDVFIYKHILLTIRNDQNHMTDNANQLYQKYKSIQMYYYIINSLFFWYLLTYIIPTALWWFQQLENITMSKHIMVHLRRCCCAFSIPMFIVLVLLSTPIPVSVYVLLLTSPPFISNSIRIQRYADINITAFLQ